jgi:hypothetical protein
MEGTVSPVRSVLHGLVSCMYVGNRRAKQMGAEEGSRGRVSICMESMARRTGGIWDMTNVARAKEAT